MVLGRRNEGNLRGVVRDGLSVREGDREGR